MISLELLVVTVSNSHIVTFKRKKTVKNVEITSVNKYM